MMRLPWGYAMKKFILMTLVTATALSPMAAYAAEILPQSANASAKVEATADFQRGERGDRGRGERGRGRDETRGEGQRGESRRGERSQGQARAQRVQQAPIANVRTQRQQANVQVERRDAQPVARQYNRTHDGDSDRRAVANRDSSRERNWDRNRTGQVERNYDRSRYGQIDHRYDRNNDYRGDRWSHDWRNDSRYNWREHRHRYGNYYRPGRYYAPYRNHRYSRIYIGFFLGSGFYGSNYWIGDPYYYRLPLAYGPYRWVRYYDDVLLIDIRNGRVVDVIENFFW